jgi:predicted RNase H-like nuclease (RuvC/YqgF family)
MAPEERQRWQEFDERMAEAENRLQATANLVRPGIPILHSQQRRIDALIDSEARHYLHLQEIDERLARLAESQQRTDETVARLADSIQKLIDSGKFGGNGSR